MRQNSNLAPPTHPSKRISFFSKKENDLAKSPKTIGKNVQVGDNFLIVHPNKKYPTREVIYGSADYLANVRLNNQSNSRRPTSGVPFNK